MSFASKYQHMSIQADLQYAVLTITPKASVLQAYVQIQFSCTQSTLSNIAYAYAYLGGEVGHLAAYPIFSAVSCMHECPLHPT